MLQPVASKDSGDLFGFSPPPTKPKTAAATATERKKKDNRFPDEPLGGDASGDLFSTASPPLVPASVPAAKPAKKDKLDDLFDEEEDFQAAKPTPKPAATQPAAKPPPSGGLFSDEDSDDLFSGFGAPKATSVPNKEEEARPQKKKLPGAVSMFGGGDPSALAAAAAARGRGAKESKKGELAATLVLHVQYLPCSLYSQSYRPCNRCVSKHWRGFLCFKTGY